MRLSICISIHSILFGTTLSRASFFISYNVMDSPILMFSLSTNTIASSYDLASVKVSFHPIPIDGAKMLMQKSGWAHCCDQISTSTLKFIFYKKRYCLHFFTLGKYLTLTNTSDKLLAFTKNELEVIECFFAENPSTLKSAIRLFQEKLISHLLQLNYCAFLNYVEIFLLNIEKSKLNEYDSGFRKTKFPLVSEYPYLVLAFVEIYIGIQICCTISST